MGFWAKKHRHVLVVAKFWKEKSTTDIEFFLWDLSKEEKHRHDFAISGFWDRKSTTDMFVDRGTFCRLQIIWFGWILLLVAADLVVEEEVAGADERLYIDFSLHKREHAIVASLFGTDSSYIQSSWFFRVHRCSKRHSIDLLEAEASKHRTRTSLLRRRSLLWELERHIKVISCGFRSLNKVW